MGGHGDRPSTAQAPRPFDHGRLRRQVFSQRAAIVKSVHLGVDRKGDQVEGIPYPAGGDSIPQNRDPCRLRSWFHPASTGVRD